MSKCACDIRLATHAHKCFRGSEGVGVSDFWKGFKGDYMREVHLTVGGINKQIKQNVAIVSKEDQYLKDLLRVNDTKGLTQ